MRAALNNRANREALNGCRQSFLTPTMYKC